MQFRDLQRQYQALKPQIDDAMMQVASSGGFILGQKVVELESRLSQYVGVQHCVSCGSGTDALALALKVWGIGPGDAVFVPDFTFFASAEVVSAEGATPIFVDVDPHTFNIDVNHLQQCIKNVEAEGNLTPRVIIAVDLFGLPAIFPIIQSIAKQHGLWVLEDAAQGFGGSIQGQRACSFGDIAATSFFPAKPLGCYGDGGALFTHNQEWADLARSLRVHGKGADKYDNVRIGLNSRLDALQAAILHVKFDAFQEHELQAVNDVATQYTSLLGDIVACPTIPDGFGSSWAQYTLRLDNKDQRDQLQQYLKTCNIPSMVYYPKAMHQQSAFAYLNNNTNICPITTQLCDTVLSLPMHPYMTSEEIVEVADAVKAFIQK